MNLLRRTRTNHPHLERQLDHARRRRLRGDDVTTGDQISQRSLLGHLVRTYLR